MYTGIQIFTYRKPLLFLIYTNVPTHNYCKNSQCVEVFFFYYYYFPNIKWIFLRDNKRNFISKTATTLRLLPAPAVLLFFVLCFKCHFLKSKKRFLFLLNSKFIKCVIVFVPKIITGTMCAAMCFCWIICNKNFRNC